MNRVGNASLTAKSLGNGLGTGPESARVEEMRREESSALTIPPSCCRKRNHCIRGTMWTSVYVLLCSARGIVSVGTGEDFVRWLGWGIAGEQGDLECSSAEEPLLVQKSEGVQGQISQAQTTMSVIAGLEESVRSNSCL